MSEETKSEETKIVYRCPNDHEQGGPYWWGNERTGVKSKPVCFQCWCDWVSRKFPTEMVK